jgi:hypothetical protein
MRAALAESGPMPPGLVRPKFLAPEQEMGRKGGGVPDRWEAYTNIGNLVPGTRFVAFKVPLQPGLLAQVELPYILLTNGL